MLISVHQGPVPSVVRFSLNFCHYFIFKNGVNPENLTLKTFSNKFLLVFKNFKILMNCSSLFVSIFRNK